MARLAYYGHIPPSESGQLRSGDARELLRQIDELREADEKMRAEHTKAIINGFEMLAKLQIGTAQMIGKALGAMR